MKRKRHTPEEIIKKLREAATLLAGGQSVEEVCKKLEVSPPTYHRWRQEYGGAKEETVKRLKELEKENGRLKRIVADMALDNAMLKELAEGAEWNETAKRRRAFCPKGSTGGCWQHGEPGAQAHSGPAFAGEL
jgi:putative transposase